jgi:hypothetical protein
MPASQGFDSLQHFWGERLCVVRHDVSLDSARTSPHEIAEWAAVPRHVHSLHVSLEFLGSSEVLAAISTGRSRPAVRGTIQTSLILRETLGSEMTPHSAGLCIVVKLCRACIVGRCEIGLYTRLNQSEAGFDLRARSKA